MECLPDDFVHEDIEAYELLPDQFVMEEESPVVFASPSDAPPRPEPPTLKPPEDATRSRWGGDLGQRPWVRTLFLPAAAGIAGLLVMARFTGSAPARSPTAKVHPAAASPMPISAPEIKDPSSSRVPASPPNRPSWESSGFSPFGDVPAAEAGASLGPEPASEALEKKQASLQALEKGKLALSIELGERAVELDPTEGDSWLILGGAYLQRGDTKNARRCFSSCVQQATSGQLKECAALLR